MHSQVKAQVFIFITATLLCSVNFAQSVVYTGSDINEYHKAKILDAKPSQGDPDFAVVQVDGLKFRNDEVKLVNIGVGKSEVANFVSILKHNPNVTLVLAASDGPIVEDSEKRLYIYSENVSLNFDDGEVVPLKSDRYVELATGKYSLSGLFRESHDEAKCKGKVSVSLDWCRKSHIGY